MNNDLYSILFNEDQAASIDSYVEQFIHYLKEAKKQKTTMTKRKEYREGIKLLSSFSKQLKSIYTYL